MSDTKEAWEKFFEQGSYAEIYHPRFSEENTIQQTENIIKLLDLQKGDHVLDWCGGWGRHSIQLAIRGFEVTLLDYAPVHILTAQKNASKAGVTINTICTDFRKTPSTIQADTVINMFTAGLGYLTEEDDLKALRSLHKAIKKGAPVLIDTINLFWIARHYILKTWSVLEEEKVLLLEERTFDIITNRATMTLTLDRQGEKETHTLSHRVFTPADLAKLLERASFQVKDVFGDFEGGSFDFDSKRIIMIAESA